jgi:hypothetical protein
MVALGIESGRKRQHMGGTKLHAEAARFTALHDNGNTSFCHGISTVGAAEQPPKSGRNYCFEVTQVDVTVITDVSEAAHRLPE